MYHLEAQKLMNRERYNEIEIFSNLLDIKVTRKMEEFTILGRRAKEMLNKYEDRQEVDSLYLEMARIFNDLKPIEKRIRQDYSHMNHLFDDLKFMYSEYRIKVLTNFQGA